MIGGVGYVIGAAFSAPNALGGLGTLLMEEVLGIGSWDALVGGIILLLIIVFQQDGIAAAATRDMRPLLRKLHLVTDPTARDPLREAEREAVPPRTLAVAGLTVRFGGVTAVNQVDFEVRPGEVVGLIGPNGAGKTTIIDAVTGFVRPAAGSISLDGRSHRRVERLPSSAGRSPPVVPVARAVRGRHRRGQHQGRRRHRHPPRPG